MQRKGFTLVEIMIVVAIIGILIAIAVPGFLRAREISRRNACQENQTKIDGAVQQYILEFRLPGLDDFPGAGTEQGSVGDVTWLYGDPETAADGVAIIFGENSYVRFAPACPAGGIYGLIASAADVDQETGEYAVYCTLRNRTDDDVARAFWHVFPGTDDTIDPPAPGGGG